MGGVLVNTVLKLLQFVPIKSMPYRITVLVVALKKIS